MSEGGNTCFDKSCFPDYTDIRRIGTGGFSSVYSAFHKLAKMPVAIKHIAKKRLNSETNIRNFHREIEIMKRADHPFIAHFFDLIETEDSYYIVMEYAPKDTLLSRINSEGELTMKELQRTFAQIASALTYLQNDLKIIHRDLKLENILYDENDNIRLIDFGLSCEMETEDDKFRTLCGSYPYAAPEIFHQTPYSQEIDVWSMGVCLYSAAVGKLPFYNRNTSKLIQSILKSEPSYPPTIPTPLVDLIKKMLTKDPNQRITLAQIVEHPFFSGTPIDFYLDYARFTVTPTPKTGLDPEVAERLVELGLNPMQSRFMGTKEFLIYRILRSMKVSVMMCHESEFAQVNPIQQKFSAPTVAFNDPLAKKLKNSQYSRNVSSINHLNGSHLMRLRKSSLAVETEQRKSTKCVSRLKCPRKCIILPAKNKI